MMGSLWYKPQSAAQSLYYTLRCLAEADFRLRSDLTDQYGGEYLYPLKIVRDFIPFALVRPASKIFHVGFDRIYFNKGISHPLIEAALAGERGTVRCIDPDQRNVDALNGFAKQHGITQLKAHHGAAWNQEEELEFAFDKDWSPLSGSLAIEGQRERASRSHVKTVLGKPVDDIMPDIFGDRELDFLSLTVNGAEPQVLEGAKQTVSQNQQLCIGMALAFGHFSFEIRKEVCNKFISEGWAVIVSNAPHDPWKPDIFLWCCMVRKTEEWVETFGASRVTWEQAIELASEESAIIRQRLHAVKKHILDARTQAIEAPLPKGSLLRGARALGRWLGPRFSG